MMRVAMVLRSGGEFRQGHVGRLHKQIAEHLPGTEIVCLSDVEVPCDRIQLEYGWPGWWSKMELFRPDIEGDLLYMDLDMSIVGDLGPMLERRRLTVLSDFYWPERIQSSMMLIPECERTAIWEAWMADPERHMRECRTRERWGDQGFLGQFWNDKARRWQAEFPGWCVSYKVHVQNKSLSERARVVVFHGKPRPWTVGW